MAACSRRRGTAAAVACALALSGCVTGHVLQAGRRVEYAREIEAAPAGDGSTVVEYRAEITADDGTPVGSAVRTRRLACAPDDVRPGDLTRTWMAPWVYPLVPLTLAADAVVVPTLLLMSPAILLVGD